tara:strand:+ start:293 stop:481 length:189 start_codon:yes stop_codon:yes gene_type:complete
MKKKKKCCKAKKENTNEMKIKALEDKLKEIQLRFGAMSTEEQKIVEEAKIEINEIKNLIKNK